MILLYERKAKHIFSTSRENELGVEYKDEITAGNKAKKDTMAGKGRLNNQITLIIFRYLQGNGVESHFTKQLSKTEQLVKLVKAIPLKIVIRNIASESITKRLGSKNGEVFREPLVEFFYKNDALNDPLITDDHAKLLNITSDEDIKILKSKALKIDNMSKQLMDVINLKLVDFKIGSGETETGQILLANEISPNMCRVWSKATNAGFDKDAYRNNTGSLVEAY